MPSISIGTMKSNLLKLLYSRNLDLRSKDEYEAKVQKLSLYFLVILCIYVSSLKNNSTFYVQSPHFR